MIKKSFMFFLLLGWALGCSSLSGDIGDDDDNDDNDSDPVTIDDDDDDGEPVSHVVIDGEEFELYSVAILRSDGEDIQEGVKIVITSNEVGNLDNLITIHLSGSEKKGAFELYPCGLPTMGIQWDGEYYTTAGNIEIVQYDDEWIVLKLYEHQTYSACGNSLKIEELHIYAKVENAGEVLPDLPELSAPRGYISVFLTIDGLPMNYFGCAFAEEADCYGWEGQCLKVQPNEECNIEWGFIIYFNESLPAGAYSIQDYDDLSEAPFANIVKVNDFGNILEQYVCMHGEFTLENDITFETGAWIEGVFGKMECYLFKDSSVHRDKKIIIENGLMQTNVVDENFVP